MIPGMFLAAAGALALVGAELLIKVIAAFTQLLVIPLKVTLMTAGLVCSKAIALVGPVPFAVSAAVGLLLLGATGILLVVRALR